MLQALIILSSKLSVVPFIWAGVGDEIGNGVQQIADGTITGGGATGVDALTNFISQVIKIAMPLAVLCLLILMGYGGFLMITSQGNPEKIGEAKEVISNALIGFAVIACAGAFMIVITNVLNLPITY